MYPGEEGRVRRGLKRKWTTRGSRGVGSRQVKRLKKAQGPVEGRRWVELVVKQIKSMVMIDVPRVARSRGE
jgi:hypothetical protein